MKNISVDTIAAPANVDPEIGPLTLEHRQDFALARNRAKSIHKAAAVASFNAWASAIVAMLSAPFALFSLSGLITTVVLGLVAANEFRGRRRLLQYDPAAASILGWNQIALLVLIVAYSGWSIYSNLYGNNSVSNQLQEFSRIDSGLVQMDGIDALMRQFVVGVYGGVIAISVIFQGLNALYYFSRRKHIETYLAETPAWIRELQRTAHTH